MALRLVRQCFYLARVRDDARQWRGFTIVANIRSMLGSDIEQDLSPVISSRIEQNLVNFLRVLLWLAAAITPLMIDFSIAGREQ